VYELLRGLLSGFDPMWPVKSRVQDSPGNPMFLVMKVLTPVAAADTGFQGMVPNAQELPAETAVGTLHDIVRKPHVSRRVCFECCESWAFSHSTQSA
jgi:hypothetical protein